MIIAPLVKIAFVDDDEDMRRSTCQTLQLAGLEPVPFDRAETALASIDADFPGVVITDLRMPGIDGLQLFEALKKRDPDLPVLLITGHGDVATAVSAIRRGVYDFITKPFSTDALLLSVRRALDRRRAELDNRQLQRQAENAAAQSALIGISPAAEQLRRTIGQLAQADVDILIEGETGTGKNLVASLIHRASRRRRHPMVTLDCGALPQAMIESELFGHVPDAYPGARWTRVGRIEEANLGTLYVDQVEMLPLSVQPKLLRACDERQITPLGTNESKPVDFRLVASASDRLADRVSDGRMLDSLYYRLNAVEIHMTPLRNRTEDIPILLTHFLQEAARTTNVEAPRLTDEIWRNVMGYPWPGNVRELANYARRLSMGLEPNGALHPPRDESTLAEKVDAFEAEQIRKALAQANGNVGEAIARLKIPRETFYYKAKRHKISPSSWKKKQKRIER